MKIYTKVKIDIDTLETVEEDSFEYDGPIALCGGGGDVKYRQSPQQEQVFDAIYPMIRGMGKAAQGGQPLWTTPSAPQVGQAPGSMIPNAGWYDNMDSGIKAGIWEPFQDASNQMLAGMNRGGQMGTPSGGYSPAAGAAMGEFYSNAAPKVASQAWDMFGPQRQYDMWAAGANQQAQMAQWGAQNDAMSFPYRAMPGMLGGTYPEPIVSQPSTLPGSAMNMIGNFGMLPFLMGG